MTGKTALLSPPRRFELKMMRMVRLRRIVQAMTWFGSLTKHLMSGLLAIAALGALPAAAQGIDTRAREAILVDMTTGTVLFEKNADTRMPTSSMSKIMTAYMLFEAIEQGRVTLDDTLTVSEKAWRMGGSKMFVEVGSKVRIEDLIQGIIVQSGNDASVVVAEGLAGSEAEFARRMTDRARELGLTNSNFVNATGWPDPDHYSTARDLALLAQRMITDFPQYYHFYSQKEFTWNNIRQGNRNPLLYKDIGADGLKTGHTEAAGYGLTASAERNGRRLILVVNGLADVNARSEEAERLIEWGFREFETYTLFKAGETVETARVWQGEEDAVPLVATSDVAMTIRHAARSGLRVAVRVAEPIAAPIAKGQEIATLIISAPDMPDREIPLVAGMDIERQGFVGRIFSGAKALVTDVVFGSGSSSEPAPVEQ